MPFNWRGPIVLIFIILVFFTVNFALYVYKPGIVNNNGNIDYDAKVGDLVDIDLAQAYIHYQDYVFNRQSPKAVTAFKEVSIIKDQLLSISNDKLRLHSKIFRANGLAISNKILAIIANNKNEKLAFAKSAVEAGQRGLLLIEKIQNLKEDKYRTDLKDWIDKEELLKRIKVNMFVAYAIQLKLDQKSVEEQLKKLFKEIGLSYIKYHGYHKYSEIIWLNNNNIIEL